MIQASFRVRRPGPGMFLAALVAAALTTTAPGVARGGYITGTFEDVNPGPNTFQNDFPSGGFSTGGFALNNDYDATYDTWSGFAVSSAIDNAFGGVDFSHQYGAYAPLGAGGTGAGGSATYGIAFNDAQGASVINLPTGAAVGSIDVANTTYTAQSITQGDQFARAFRQGDYLLLTILGYSGRDGTGAQVGAVPFYLADYRGASPRLVSDWTTVSLAALAGAESLAFSLTSTDVGNFGINTPTYFAVDNLVATSAVPEPSAVVLAVTGAAASGLYSACRRRRRLGAAAR